MISQQTSYITHISWGCMEIALNGKTLTFKDCKVWPEGAEEWDWSLTDTHHQPGIQPEDIEEILEQDIDIMVLSCGMEMRLHTSLETEQLLQLKDIEYYIEETNQAVALFNQLSQQGKRVGGIFHSTC